MRRARLSVTKCILLATLLLVSIPAIADQPRTIGKTFLYETWQRQDGLPQISVTALVQDTQGYLWVGTEDGLARFDGSGFTAIDRRNTPELRSNEVKALLADRDGSLWIATRRGLAHRWQGGLKTYTLTDGLPSDDIRSLAQSHDGTLWVGTAAGLVRREIGTTFEPFGDAHEMPYGAVLALLVDREGALWIGTEAGLGRLANGRFENVFATDAELSGGLVQTIYEDLRGDLWIGTDIGAHRYRRGTAGHPLETYTVADGLAYPSVGTFGEDVDGDLWLGTHGGLSRFTDGTFVSYGLESAPGAPGNRVRALWLDHEGSLWAGTGLRGLLRLRKSYLTLLGTPEGLIDDLVWTIYEDRQGAMWVGTNNGLTRIASDGSMTHYRPGRDLPGPDVRALLEDRRGDMWIGTEDAGLARLRDGKIRAFDRDDGLAGDSVYVMLEDSSGILWLGTEAGLNRLVDQRFEHFTHLDGLPHDRIRSLYEDPDGALWIGTDEGLARFDGDSLKSMPLPAPDIVKTISGDGDGALWIGTAESGLLRYADDRYTTFSVADGLFDHLVHRVIDDGRGWLWMSSNQGLFRVALADFDAVTEGRAERLRSISYNEAQGMRSRECNGGGHPAGLMASDGRLWFPTIEGVVIVDPESLDLNEVPPPVHLERILADHREVDLSDSPVILAPNTREVEFDYVALSFLDPEKVSYRYRLLGFDRNWIDVGNRRSAYYTNLDPGPYTFQVIAANSDGTWNQQGAAVEVRVLPAFYETWTFFLFLSVFVAIVSVGLYRFRVRQLLRRNRLLTQTKAELELKNAEVEAKRAEMESFTYAVSHDLKSPLVTVRGFLGAIRRDLERGRMDRVRSDLERVDRNASRMQRLIDELLQLSRIGHVVHEPEEIPMTDLAREAVDAVSGRLAERGVAIDLARDMPTVFGDRRRLLEVLQNLTDNAVKFMGDQSQPQIRIGWLDDRAIAEGASDFPDGVEAPVFFVSDNGAGIEPDYQKKIFGLFERLDPEIDGTGIGLAKVKRVIEMHGGQVWVESEGSGRGSSFYFTLPS